MTNKDRWFITLNILVLVVFISLTIDKSVKEIKNEIRAVCTEVKK